MLVLVALIITTVKTNEGSADSDVKIKENDNDTTAVIQNVTKKLIHFLPVFLVSSLDPLGE